jgi:Flp pilus assembly protein TadG
MRRLRRNRKGISTVIATIIIVAIAIVMAIAVAYWAMGIGGSFTRFEKLQFISAYAPSDSTVQFTIKNTGTAAATVDAVMVNGQPLNGTVSYDFSHGNSSGPFTTSLLYPGDSTNGTISFTNQMVSGTAVEVTLQTAAGNQYPQVVVPP